MENKDKIIDLAVVKEKTYEYLGNIVSNPRNKKACDELIETIFAGKEITEKQLDDHLLMLSNGKLKYMIDAQKTIFEAIAKEGKEARHLIAFRAKKAGVPLDVIADSTELTMQEILEI